MDPNEAFPFYFRSEHSTLDFFFHFWGYFRPFFALLRCVWELWTHRPSPMAPCPASPIARFPPLASPTSTKEFFAQCAHRPRHLAPSHHHRGSYCPHFPFLPHRPQHRVISASPPSRRLPVILSLSPSRCLLPPLPHRQAALKQQPRPPHALR